MNIVLYISCLNFLPAWEKKYEILRARGQKPRLDPPPPEDAYDKTVVELCDRTRD